MRRAYAGLGFAMAAIAAVTIPEMTERGLVYPPRGRPVMRRSENGGSPYHRPGIDSVLMDWDLPKGKRAKRRAKKRAAVTQDMRHD